VSLILYAKVSVLGQITMICQQEWDKNTKFILKEDKKGKKSVNNLFIIVAEKLLKTNEKQSIRVFFTNNKDSICEKSQ
jgi:hypothetical protein